jgi:hypothetical protein
LDPNIPPTTTGKIQPSKLNPGKIIYSKDLIFKGGSHGSTLSIIPEAKETFGELSQTTPVAMIGGTFFPKAPGVQLDMNIANNRLRFGFAIRHVMVMN